MIVNLILRLLSAFQQCLTSIGEPGKFIVCGHSSAYVLLNGFDARKNYAWWKTIPNIKMSLYTDDMLE